MTAELANATTVVNFSSRHGAVVAYGIAAELFSQLALLYLIHRTKACHRCLIAGLSMNIMKSEIRLIYLFGMIIVTRRCVDSSLSSFYWLYIVELS